jgi:hypothetical protein
MLNIPLLFSKFYIKMLFGQSSTVCVIGVWKSHFLLKYNSNLFLLIKTTHATRLFHRKAAKEQLSQNNARHSIIFILALLIPLLAFILFIYKMFTNSTVITSSSFFQTKSKDELKFHPSIIDTIFALLLSVNRSWWWSLNESRNSSVIQIHLMPS